MLAFAVETGIMDLTTELTIDDLPACSYSVTSPDLNPAKHYGVLAGSLIRSMITIHFNFRIGMFNRWL